MVMLLAIFARNCFAFISRIMRCVCVQHVRVRAAMEQLQMTVATAGNNNIIAGKFRLLGARLAHYLAVGPEWRQWFCMANELDSPRRSVELLGWKKY